tara:strand:+ start:356 stop:805 length:450 start_codon:yes stop_codon:yes gene_type:complete
MEICNTKNLIKSLKIPPLFWGDKKLTKGKKMNKEEKLLLELKHFKYDVLQKITDLEKIIGKPIEPKKSFKSISSKYLSNAENFRLFAINEIKTLGEPMHLNDILDKAKEKNVKVPGRGGQANAIICITRDPQRRFKRYAKGIYELMPEL